MTANAHSRGTGGTGAEGSTEATRPTPVTPVIPVTPVTPVTGTLRHTVVDSPLGVLTLVADGEALTGVYFENHLRGPSPGAIGPRDPTGFDEAERQLREYFAGERRRFDLPLAPRGEPFQQSVWRLLREIPYGETRSYGLLARELGDPALAQAVGAANGRNPLSVIVPCHRVVGADGSLTGYAGGLERKRLLLELEGADSVTRTGRLF
ncbi:methylated-DNA--[protein]-cysteine S-methyltransferase [Streptomyces sp. HNM0575]|uniref:methylated-DNA--[protein]-cysteine S-methyltransferase n=1 Tax=Streptomyces sp. HNM0575 TaxID=2716338 RepID=UPI00145F1FB0|nr:methylated-DNA--[protein]-cysteine S-methyltransferase [Streptomyces sp. HNM0575]NLU73111.1 methylated-DNA--[protein]-cysteine S-methyltransferase [Streptomyces sp. HNM0575]